MYKQFLTARSPLRLLEKGLHGGLGRGNLGLVVAGRGVGKTPVLVGFALDELLREGRVLHISFDQSVAHVRDYYNTVFSDLAHSVHLEDAARIHADIDRQRGIRAYPGMPFSTGKLREAVKLEGETCAQPTLLVIEGIQMNGDLREELADLKALAQELSAEVWLSAANSGEHVGGIPSDVAPVKDFLSVILALEPASDCVRLRALKDHENPDVTSLHVALDPRTLLLTRN